MMKFALYLSLFILLLKPYELLAQMALPSIFSGTKAVNPAVLTMRKSGNMRSAVQFDNIKKNQNITNLDGVDFKLADKSKIDLINTNLFKAGKGTGCTSEISFDHTMGTKKTEITDSSNTTTNYTTTANSSYLNASLGMADKFGIGLIYVGYHSKYSFQQKINGTTYSDNNSSKTTILGIKPGVVFGSNNFSIGATAEYDKVSNNQGATATAQKIIGLALATGGPNLLLELGVEFDPFAKTSDPAMTIQVPMPTKISFILETRILGLTLGYKGMLFKGAFIDLDKIIQTNLVFGNLGDESRLEHIFNFSLGKETGLSFGGSASFSSSSTKEKSQVFPSKNKHDTKSTAMSVGLKVAYTY